MPLSANHANPATPSSQGALALQLSLSNTGLPTFGTLQSLTISFLIWLHSIFYSGYSEREEDAKTRINPQCKFKSLTLFKGFVVFPCVVKRGKASA